MIKNYSFTRPDTIFGATFLAISCDHELVDKLLTKNEALKNFIDECKNLNSDKVKRVMRLVYLQNITLLREKNSNFYS